MLSITFTMFLFDVVQVIHHQRDLKPSYRHAIGEENSYEEEQAANHGSYIEGEGNPPAAGGSSAGILFVGFFAIAGVFLCFKVRKDLRENAEKAKGYKNVSNEDEEGEGGDERDGGGGGGRGTRMWK